MSLHETDIGFEVQNDARVEGAAGANGSDAEATEATCL